MALNIENDSGGLLPVDDLGIEMSIGQIVDLSVTSDPFAVANSATGGDLDTLVTATSLIVKDPIDGTTNLSVVDGLAALRAMNETHWRVGAGARAQDVAFTPVTDNSETDVQAAIAENSGKVQWKNEWAEGTYDKNDMVIDGDWTMIANTSTSERAAPQPIGDPDVTPVPDTVFSTDSDISVVKMVHNYTVTETGWVSSIKVRVPSWDLDSVSRVTLLNVTSGNSRVIYNPILADDIWVQIVDTNIFIATSDVIEVWFEFYNSSAANSVDGGWTSDIATGTPSLANFKINSVTVPTVVSIDHTDLESADRSTELDGVVANSIITIVETSDPTRYIEVGVVSVNTAPSGYTEYTVALISIGAKNIRDDKICSVHIDVPITQPSEYSVNTDYYLGVTNQPDFATVVTRLYYDGVQQADVNDAYGIELTFQQALVSADWDVVSTSQGGGSSSSGTSGGITELTGDVSAGPGTGSQVATISADAVTYAKMQNVVSDDVLLGNISGAGGIVAELTAAQVRTLLNITSGAAPDQNLWETITSDSGSAVANTTTDTLTIAGGTGISTAIVGDTLTITATGGDLASVVVTNTVDSVIPLVYTNVTWDTTDVENDTSVIEHDNVNTERLLIKETGLYFVNFSISFDADVGEEQIAAKVVIDDTTDVPASERTASEDDEINDLSNAITAELTAGTYLTLQVIAAATGNLLHLSSNFAVIRARGSAGATGATGATGAGSNIIVQEDDSTVGTVTDTLNFEGTAITSVVDDGGNKTTVTIDGAPATMQLFADQFESPVNSDWAVNALAPVAVDSNNSGLTVRLFDDTTDEGVGCTFFVPTGATDITLRFRSRAETAPPAVRTVGVDLYIREIPDNSAVGAWDAGTALTDISIPANENFQYDEQTLTLDGLGMTAGNIYQFEWVRTNPGAGTELVGDWALLGIEVEFS